MNRFLNTSKYLDISIRVLIPEYLVIRVSVFGYQYLNIRVSEYQYQSINSWVYIWWSGYLSTGSEAHWVDSLILTSLKETIVLYANNTNYLHWSYKVSISIPTCSENTTHSSFDEQGFPMLVKSVWSLILTINCPHCHYCFSCVFESLSLAIYHLRVSTTQKEWQKNREFHVPTQMFLFLIFSWICWQLKLLLSSDGRLIKEIPDFHRYMNIFIWSGCCKCLKMFKRMFIWNLLLHLIIFAKLLIFHFGHYIYIYL